MLCVMYQVFLMTSKHRAGFPQVFARGILLAAKIAANPYNSSNQMHLFLKLFILHNTLHVSDGLSVHHQEFTTLRTATGMSNTQ
jgi:hypothetical protein